MQIILSDEEVEVIYESLLTEEVELEKEKIRETRKGRGGLEKKQLARVTSLKNRFFPYLVKK